METWIQTYTGRKFWPLDPKPEDVHILDIAHALSMKCRYSGHCKRFYSIAEHSCHVHDVLTGKALEQSPIIKMWGLLHDAGEAYLCDVPRPVKPELKGFKRLERNIQEVVARKFGLYSLGFFPEVSVADNAMLHAEYLQNMQQLRELVWEVPEPPADVKLGYWYPDRAKREFMARFRLLRCQLKGGNTK